MQSSSQTVPVSRGTPWIGRVMSGLPALFLAVDGMMKLAKPAPVVESMRELGYPERLTVGIGILLLACLAAYLYPRSSVLGAVLLTGYLGGAVASHVRVEAGLFPIFFPIVLGMLLWGGLFLRDERLRALVSPRN